jgi:hypothetical protein
MRLIRSHDYTPASSQKHISINNYLFLNLIITPYKISIFHNTYTL